MHWYPPVAGTQIPSFWHSSTVQVAEEGDGMDIHSERKGKSRRKGGQTVTRDIGDQDRNIAAALEGTGASRKGIGEGFVFVVKH